MKHLRPKTTFFLGRCEAALRRKLPLSPAGSRVFTPFIWPPPPPPPSSGAFGPARRRPWPAGSEQPRVQPGAIGKTLVPRERPCAVTSDGFFSRPAPADLQPARTWSACVPALSLQACVWRIKIHEPLRFGIRVLWKCSSPCTGPEGWMLGEIRERWQRREGAGERWLRIGGGRREERRRRRNSR